MSIDFLRDGLIWVVVWLLPLGIAALIAYLVLTLPHRKLDQIQLLLDVLETGLRRGDSPERTIISVSESRERSLGARFHLLAAYLEEGVPLVPALQVTRGYLPENISSMLQLGISQNTLASVLPAARAALAEGNSRLRNGLNYLVLLFFVLGPVSLVLMSGVLMKVAPKMQWMFQEMFDGTIAPPALPMLVFGNMWLITAAQIALVVVLICFGITYIWHDGAMRLARKLFGSLPDRLLMLLPWRRRRAQRDFTGMLATLLDAGITEKDALALAAKATANRVIIARAERAAAHLASGAALPDALRGMGVGREFQWRWANALRGGKDFFAALRGWHDWLNAKSFQEEQAAGHVISAGFVLLNGAVVTLLLVAVFQILTALIEQEALWY